MWRFSLLFAISSLAAAAPPEFDRDVKPLLARRCLTCHGGGSTVMGGLDMTTRASLLQGGKQGVDVEPGKPEKSRLIARTVEGTMPPGKRLEPAEIEVLREWIAAGARWGSEPSLAAGRGKSWWAFQSPVKPVPPVIPGRQIVNPIDAFLLAKLREKGLDFSPRASQRDLVRRLYFDLAGLPPGPGDVAGGYRETMERLLASPDYAENWARHWLDVVRFGETDGGEHNIERHHAWRFRDWVINAFARDMPYPEFVRQQIAGDAFAPDDKTAIAATGFLVAGPWDSVTAEINKDKIMVMTNRQDELDDMLTATFASFQALTVNCARCHDHKFDPIPQRDYYRITAVFSGAGFGTREVASAAERAAYEEKAGPIKKELDQVKKQIGDIDDPVRARLLAAKFRALGEPRRAGERPIAVNPVWNRNAFAPVRARYFRFVITGHQGKVPKLETLELLPGGQRVDSWMGAAQASADQPVILPLSAPGTVSEIRWASDASRGQKDGMIKVYRLEASEDGAAWRTVCSSLEHESGIEVELPEVSASELDKALPASALAAREALRAQRATIQARLDAVPPLHKVYAVKPHPVAPAFVLERGSVTRPKEPVDPGALSVIGQLESSFAEAGADEGARRRALARWITDPKNPLTARVIVNRVWQAHFGNGIVNTPSDFGVNGDRPSHPELLDWLAVSFMENGWSLKWLHRQILTSEAYQQSSAMQENAHAVDAGNRLVWRMPLKRMDAETLRDSMLAVAGNLNSKRGGPSFVLQTKDDKGSYIYKAREEDQPEFWRRSVYRFVVRGGERLFLDSFDCPDPSVATPQRSVSNTPIQALTLLNNSFVLRQAGLLAARLEREAGADPSAQIQRAYQLLYGRDARAFEVDLGQRAIAADSLTVYCRALFNTNEFVYVP